ncbi:hypothetical protein E8E95_16255 [Pseudomonas sp. BN414]|uniref:LuxR C-terminal-related transcriptional regulator n=1 Tax=unclassified Pseudomonas TaxID=196821 RepID=UPI0024561F3F|nr:MULTISPECIES: LuxR C-terminal-related transcriptional regulator [unclassified Pseudomonas]MDH4568238.1 hypothetical protein [Pseudomonas sp. BN414]MDH4580703.1 hypothetical protein [Pseudomonas sp. BN415]
MYRDTYAVAPVVAIKPESRTPLSATRSPAFNTQGLIVRPRLMKQLRAAQGLRVISLRAPAGYGRSILLSQYFIELQASGAACFWIGCRNDADAAEMLIALRDVFCRRADLTSLHAVPGSCLRSAMQLRDIKTPLYVFIDDLQCVEGAVVEAIDELLERAPANLHFLLSGRGQPSLRLARFRMRGELLDLDVHDMAFDEDEIACHFESQGLESSLFSEVPTPVQRIEGWVGGLNLLSRAIRSGSGQLSNLTSVEERALFQEFFFEEVFESLESNLQDFLVSCAILERLEPEACAIVSKRIDGLSLLKECQSRDLFVFTDHPKSQTYRLHTLFREFLLTYLAENDGAKLSYLHREASDFYVLKEEFFKAFNHALSSGDQELAASIIEDNHVAFFERSDDIAWRMVEQLPSALISRYPRILISQAWSMLHLWKFETAKELLAQARRCLSDPEYVAKYSPDFIEVLRSELLHREAMLSMMIDDTPLLETQARSLVEKYSDAHPIIRGSIYNALLYAQRERFKLDEIERLSNLTREYLSRGESKLSIIVHEAVIGPSRFMGGQTEAVITGLTKALAAAESIAGVGSPYATILALPLAEVHYERNELDQARRLLEIYLPHVEAEGFVDQAIAGWLTAARLAFNDGDPETAFDLLDKAEVAAAKHGFDRLHYSALAERLRCLLRMGEVNEMIRQGRKHGLIGQFSHLKPSLGVTTKDEVKALCSVRVAIAQNRLNEAMDLAKHWQRYLAKADATRNFLRWDVVHTHLLVLTGDERGAQRNLKRSLELAARGRFIRTFSDEGAWLSGLLMGAESASGEEGKSAEEFIEEVLISFRDTKNSVVKRAEPAVVENVLGALNGREIEILQLVDEGLRNKEIGRALSITEGCVKWYLQQVFDKIGTRRRAQAASRARQLGLMR